MIFQLPQIPGQSPAAARRVFCSPSWCAAGLLLFVFFITNPATARAAGSASSAPGVRAHFISTLPMAVMGEDITVSEIAMVVIALCIIGWLVMRSVEFYKTMWPQRSPSIEVEFATKAEVKAMISEVVEDLKEDQVRIEGRIDTLVSTTQKGFEDMRRDASSRGSSLHKRIDDIAENTRGVSEVLDLIKKSLRIKIGGQS